jgi:hypothetical protein
LGDRVIGWRDEMREALSAPITPLIMLCEGEIVKDQGDAGVKNRCFLLSRRGSIWQSSGFSGK